MQDSCSTKYKKSQPQHWHAVKKKMTELFHVSQILQLFLKSSCAKISLNEGRFYIFLVYWRNVLGLFQPLAFSTASPSNIHVGCIYMLSLCSESQPICEFSHWLIIIGSKSYSNIPSAKEWLNRNRSGGWWSFILLHVPTYAQFWTNSRFPFLLKN